MSEKLLILTVGLPRSGKSTWAKAQECPVVNPDSIRLALHGQRFVAKAEPYVWAIARTMVEALFLAGHDQVILDACNISRSRRDEWVGNWHREFVFVNTPVSICLERADEELKLVVNRMAGQYEPIWEDEGNVYIIDFHHSESDIKL